jgi:opacity protein-like surface antigen
MDHNKAPVAKGFSGGFVGVGLGLNVLDITLHHTRAGEKATDDSDNLTQSTQGIHVGYGHEFANKTYMGLNAFWAIAQHKQQDDVTFFNASQTFSRTLEFGQTFGMNGEFGYAVNNKFMPYLIAGWEWQRVKHTIAHDSFFVSESVEESGYINGPDVGLGMRYHVSDSLSVGMDYRIAFYGSKTFTNTVTGGLGTVTHVFTVKANPVMQAMVNMDYLFSL